MWGKCGENDGNDLGHLWVSQKKLLEHQENKECMKTRGCHYSEMETFGGGP
jgi:hypothetical protein